MRAQPALPIWLVASEDDASLGQLTEAQRNWVEARGWVPKPGRGAAAAERERRHCRGLARRRQRGLGLRDAAPSRCLARRRCRPAIIASPRRCRTPELATVAWLAGSYRFARYKSGDDAEAKRLILPDGVDRGRVLALAEALYFGRDLINTPANDLGPAELEAAARELAVRCTAPRSR